MTNFMELVDDDWDDEPRYRGPGRDERLRHLVFLDGTLVDCFVESLEGSEYEMTARDLEARRAPCEAKQPTPQWEHDLANLDPEVGGRAALLALPDGTLEPRPLPEDCAEVSGLLDALEFGEEFTVAVRNALAHLAEVQPELLRGARRPEQVAAALTWIVARANQMTGAGRCRQIDIARIFGANSLSSDLVYRLAHAFQRYLPERKSLWSGYSSRRDELGRADVLVSTVRGRIIRERDLALAAAERARRDDEVRAGLVAGS